MTVIFLAAISTRAGSSKIESTVLTLDDKSFDAALIDHPKLAVFFSDSKCSECELFDTAWSQLSQEYTAISSEVVLAKINLSENPTTKKRFGVRSEGSAILIF